MIMLVGVQADPPLAAVARELTLLKVQAVTLDVHRPDVRVARAWRPGRESAVVVNGREVDLDDVTAAYLRPPPLTAVAL